MHYKVHVFGTGEDHILKSQPALLKFINANRTTKGTKGRTRRNIGPKGLKKILSGNGVVENTLRVTKITKTVKEGKESNSELASAPAIPPSEMVQGEKPLPFKVRRNKKKAPNETRSERTVAPATVSVKQPGTGAAVNALTKGTKVDAPPPKTATRKKKVNLRTGIRVLARKRAVAKFVGYIRNTYKAKVPPLQMRQVLAAIAKIIRGLQPTEVRSVIATTAKELKSTIKRVLSDIAKSTGMDQSTRSMDASTMRMGTVRDDFRMETSAEAAAYYPDDDGVASWYRSAMGTVDDPMLTMDIETVSNMIVPMQAALGDDVLMASGRELAVIEETYRSSASLNETMNSASSASASSAAPSLVSEGTFDSFLSVVAPDALATGSIPGSLISEYLGPAADASVDANMFNTTHSLADAKDIIQKVETLQTTGSVAGMDETAAELAGAFARIAALEEELRRVATGQDAEIKAETERVYAQVYEQERQRLLNELAATGTASSVSSASTNLSLERLRQSGREAEERIAVLRAQVEEARERKRKSTTGDLPPPSKRRGLSPPEAAPVAPAAAEPRYPTMDVDEKVIKRELNESSDLQAKKQRIMDELVSIARRSSSSSGSDSSVRIVDPPKVTPEVIDLVSRNSADIKSIASRSQSPSSQEESLDKAAFDDLSEISSITEGTYTGGPFVTSSKLEHLSGRVVSNVLERMGNTASSVDAQSIDDSVSVERSRYDDRESKSSADFETELRVRAAQVASRIEAPTPVPGEAPRLPRPNLASQLQEQRERLVPPSTRTDQPASDSSPVNPYQAMLDRANQLRRATEPESDDEYDDSFLDDEDEDDGTAVSRDRSRAEDSTESRILNAVNEFLRASKKPPLNPDEETIVLNNYQKNIKITKGITRFKKTPKLEAYLTNAVTDPPADKREFFYGRGPEDEEGEDKDVPMGDDAPVEVDPMEQLRRLYPLSERSVHQLGRNTPDDYYNFRISLSLQGSPSKVNKFNRDFALRLFRRPQVEDRINQQLLEVAQQYRTEPSMYAKYINHLLFFLLKHKLKLPVDELNKIETGLVQNYLRLYGKQSEVQDQAVTAHIRMMVNRGVGKNLQEQPLVESEMLTGAGQLDSIEAGMQTVIRTTENTEREKDVVAARRSHRSHRRGMVMYEPGGSNLQRQAKLAPFKTPLDPELRRPALDFKGPVSYTRPVARVTRFTPGLPQRVSVKKPSLDVKAPSAAPMQASPSQSSMDADFSRWLSSNYPSAKANDNISMRMIREFQDQYANFPANPYRTLDSDFSQWLQENYPTAYSDDSIEQGMIVEFNDWYGSQNFQSGRAQGYEMMIRPTEPDQVIPTDWNLANQLVPSVTGSGAREQSSLRRRRGITLFTDDTSERRAHKRLRASFTLNMYNER